MTTLEAKDRLIAKLRNEIDEVRQEVVVLKETIAQLQLQVKQLLRQQYGKKSERFKDQSGESSDRNETHDQNTSSTSSDSANDANINEDSDIKDKPKPRPATRGPYQKGITWPDDLRIQEQIHSSESDAYCHHCGKAMQQMDQVYRDSLAFQPAEFYIQRQVLPKLVCCGQIKSTVVPIRPLNKVLIDASLLAEIAIAKCLDRQTYYHLQKCWLSRYQVTIPRGNMARWMIALVKPLMPL